MLDRLTDRWTDKLTPLYPLNIVGDVGSVISIHERQGRWLKTVSSMTNVINYVSIDSSKTVEVCDPQNRLTDCPVYP